MKFLLTLTGFLLFFGIQAQNRATPDQISTDDGIIWIQPITHGSAVLNWKDQYIYIDPYGGGDLFKGLMPPTMILISDIHGDHLNQNTLDALNTSNAKIFGSSGCF